MAVPMDAMGALCIPSLASDWRLRIQQGILKVPVKKHLGACMAVPMDAMGALCIPSLAKSFCISPDGRWPFRKLFMSDPRSWPPVLGGTLGPDSLG